LKKLDLTLDTTELTMEQLIDYLKRNHLKEKEELFISGSSVRPGIIVLVNDTDWELLDTNKYEMQDGDNVAFISTLHGG
jgi:ubiquitin related modifier 1